MKNSYISIGKILNFHGVRGEAKLGYSKNREDFLEKLSEVYIQIDNEYKLFEIENLKLELKKAIEKEEYEEAAKLRDKIKELEKE